LGWNKISRIASGRIGRIISFILPILPLAILLILIIFAVSLLSAIRAGFISIEEGFVGFALLDNYKHLLTSL
jgi:hypothetical protein